MKPNEIEVRLKFKVERDDQQCKYFLTVTAQVMGRLHSSLLSKIEIDDMTIANGFAGNKDEAIKMMQHNIINRILNQIMDSQRENRTFILS